jgi:VanZ family protein
LKHFVKYHLPVIIWALVIFIQSSFEAIELPPVELISADKLVHMGVFGLLAGLCYISLIHFKSVNTFTGKPVLWSAIICIVYGASDEIHQYFVPNRSSEVQDWLADAVGVIIACLIINYFLRKRFVLFKRRIA